MNRLILIAGFASSTHSAERLATVLASHFNYDDFYYLTLHNALTEPTLVYKVTEKADVFTHSAGFIALKGSHPKAIHAFNAPLPSSRRLLVVQTFLRRINEVDLRESNDPLRADHGFGYETISNKIKQYSPFLKGVIHSFDPIETAIEAHDAGVDVGLAYTDRDCYSHPTDVQISEVRSRGIKVAQIPGVHDELKLRPIETADQYFAHRY